MKCKASLVNRIFLASKLKRQLLFCDAASYCPSECAYGLSTLHISRIPFTTSTTASTIILRSLSHSRMQLGTWFVRAAIAESVERYTYNTVRSSTRCRGESIPADEEGFSRLCECCVCSARCHRKNAAIRQRAKMHGAQSGLAAYSLVTPHAKNLIFFVYCLRQSFLCSIPTYILRRSNSKHEILNPTGTFGGVGARRQRTVVRATSPDHLS